MAALADQIPNCRHGSSSPPCIGFLQIPANGYKQTAITGPPPVKKRGAHGAGRDAETLEVVKRRPMRQPSSKYFL